MDSIKLFLMALLASAVAVTVCEATKPKAVLIPFPFGSHLVEHIQVGKALQKRGFEVHLIVNSIMKVETAKKSGLNVYIIEVNIDLPPIGESLTFFKEDASAKGQITTVLSAICEEALWNNQKLLDYFKTQKFDISINDAMMFCLYTIPHELKIPYVTLTTPLFTNVLRISPLDINGCSLELDRSFLGRLKAMFGTYMNNIPATLFNNDSFVNRSSHTPYDSIWDLSRNSQLFLVNQNPLMECATPTLPFIKYVGGLDYKTPKPLTGEMAKYADSATKGLVVISFGSILKYLDEPSVKKFMNVFERLPYKFIWRLVFPNQEIKKKTRVPNNVFLSEWMPQNDLLGHKNAVLFITHGGNNGAFEGLANGVPMLNVPVFGDQNYNAMRVVAKKYGQKFNIYDFTENDLETKIKEVIENPIYRKTIKNAAKKFAVMNKVHPADRAADLIEYVLKYGSDELIPVHNELPLYQKMLWDMLLLVIGLFGMTIFLIAKLIKKGCSPKSKKHKKKD